MSVGCGLVMNKDEIQPTCSVPDVTNRCGLVMNKDEIQLIPELARLNQVVVW